MQPSLSITDTMERISRMYIRSLLLILDEFGLGGCDSIISKRGENIQWGQLGVCSAAMQVDTLQMVGNYLEALKTYLGWRPSPVKEMKSMQSGKNVRYIGGV